MDIYTLKCYSENNPTKPITKYFDSYEKVEKYVDEFRKECDGYPCGCWFELTISEF